MGNFMSVAYVHNRDAGIIINFEGQQDTNTSPEPEYHNIDIEHALSIYDVYSLHTITQ